MCSRRQICPFQINLVFFLAKINHVFSILGVTLCEILNQFQKIIGLKDSNPFWKYIRSIPKYSSKYVKLPWNAFTQRLLPFDEKILVTLSYQCHDNNTYKHGPQQLWRPTLWKVDTQVTHAWHIACVTRDYNNVKKCHSCQCFILPTHVSTAIERVIDFFGCIHDMG